MSTTVGINPEPQRGNDTLDKATNWGDCLMKLRHRGTRKEIKRTLFCVLEYF